MPLTPRGECLLDALAAAGGSRQPVAKTTVQLTRAGRTAAMPLDAIVRDPAQNVVLQAGDVITAIFQPYSFVALGAVGQNAEVPFEGGGISLAQALGRIGGLRDDRADVRSVFVFRLEHPEVLDPETASTARRTAEGLVPVVYRLDLGQGASFFTAQDFGIRDRDVLYVSNAPIADLQKFLNIVSSAAFSVTGINNAVR
jgi:polysaccharide export outer membrane protein